MTTDKPSASFTMKTKEQQQRKKVYSRYAKIHPNLVYTRHNVDLLVLSIQRCPMF